MENDFLPTQSILLQPQKKPRTNFLDSIVFEEIKPVNNTIPKNKEKEDQKILEDLKDILRCCICQDYLDDPVYDPICPHYECKKCLDTYFQKNRARVLPCPLCKRKIRKDHLIKLPLVKSIKEIISGAKNNELLNYDVDNIENCSRHPKNKVFYLCLDCKLKMCPICDEEKRKHEEKNHHIVNYERFIKLFYILKNNFEPIKNYISEKQKYINEYKNMIKLMEEQKKSYIDLFNDLSKNIENLYKENQNKMNKYIAENIQIIGNLTNFMKNIKVHISGQIKEKYNEIENLDEIEEEIKNRISKLKLEIIDEKEIADMKHQIINKGISYKTKDYYFNFNKDDLIKNEDLCVDVEENNIYTFGVYLAKDKKNVIPYLDIKKMINNKLNNTAYGVSVEYGNMKTKKKIYLERVENDKYYSYENTIPIDELFQNEMMIDIKLTILYLDLKERV